MRVPAFPYFPLCDTQASGSGAGKRRVGLNASKAPCEKSRKVRVNWVGRRERTKVEQPSGNHPACMEAKHGKFRLSKLTVSVGGEINTIAFGSVFLLL